MADSLLSNYDVLEKVVELLTVSDLVSGQSLQHREGVERSGW